MASDSPFWRRAIWASGAAAEARRGAPWPELRSQPRCGPAGGQRACSGGYCRQAGWGGLAALQLSLLTWAHSGGDSRRPWDPTADRGSYSQGHQ